MSISNMVGLVTLTMDSVLIGARSSMESVLVAARSCMDSVLIAAVSKNLGSWESSKSWEHQNLGNP